MKLNTLTYNCGARKGVTRQGRGLGSGLGKNGGSGNKGQKSRTGGGTRIGFEGGQNPIYRRVSKRGFTNEVKVTMATVTLGQLNAAFEDGATACPTCMKEKGLVKKEYNGVKVLAVGKIEKKLTIKANAFSAAAKAAIEAAGGTVEEI